MAKSYTVDELRKMGFAFTTNGDIVTPEDMGNMAKRYVEHNRKEIIDKACKCYCDDICDKSRCGMCFHKYDGEYQVKNTFQYNECNELKLLRYAMEK